MTKAHSTKRAVRERMAKTGESFSAARRHVAQGGSRGEQGIEALVEFDRQRAIAINQAIPGAPLPLWARALNPANQPFLNTAMDRSEVDPLRCAVQTSCLVAAGKLEESYWAGEQSWATGVEGPRMSDDPDHCWARREAIAVSCGLDAVAREIRRVRAAIGK